METGQVHQSTIVKQPSLVVAYAESMGPFAGLEEEDRRQIQTIVAKVQNVNADSVFSTKVLPSRILIKFLNVTPVTIEDLRIVNMSNHRIREISLNLNGSSVTVRLCRKVKKVVIKKRLERVGLDKKVLRSTVSAFMKAHASVIRDSDERVIDAVLECILRWTWDTNAADVTCKQNGDNYQFSVERLQTVTFGQLETLCDLGDYVRDLSVDFKTKVLSFLVLRASSYIQDDQAKRRKT